MRLVWVKITQDFQSPAEPWQQQRNCTFHKMANKTFSFPTCLCWPLRWKSRPLWWLQLLSGPCPPPAWCVGAAQSSELLHGLRWGSWEAPCATPSASAAGCSLAECHRTNAHTVPKNKTKYKLNPHMNTRRGKQLKVKLIEASWVLKCSWK